MTSSALQKAKGFAFMFLSSSLMGGSVHSLDILMHQVIL